MDTFQIVLLVEVGIIALDRLFALLHWGGWGRRP